MTRAIELRWANAAILACSNGTATSPRLDVPLVDPDVVTVRAQLRRLVTSLGLPLHYSMLRDALRSDTNAVRTLEDIATAGSVPAELDALERQLDDAQHKRTLWSANKDSLAHLEADETDEAEAVLQRALRSISRPTTLEPDPDVHALLAEPESEREDVIADCLAYRERLIVTGKEGHGKSTLLRQWSVQIAAGVHPFTVARMTPARVLLIDLENSREHVRRQLRPLVLSARQHGDGIENGRLVPIVRTAGLDLTDRRDVRWLQERVASNVPELLCIGPLYKMVDLDTEPGKGGTSRLAIALLDEIREEHGCAVIIEAHTAKDSSGDPYGPSIWKRWPEFGFFLKDDGTLQKWRRDRDERSWPRALKRGGDWPWTVDATPERRQPLKGKRLDALAALRKLNSESPPTTKAWEIASPMAASTFYEHVKALVNAGYVRQDFGMNVITPAGIDALDSDTPDDSE